MKERVCDVAGRILAVALSVALALLLALYSHAVALADDGSYAVTYEGSAQGLVSVSNDFFAHFETLMPGDQLHGSVTVKNNGQATQYLGFRAEPVRSTSQGAADLLERMQLSISCGGESMYDGPLLGSDLAAPIDLGAFAPTEQAQLDFTVTCPAELGNAYALSDGAVYWVFTATAEAASAGATAPFTLDDGVKLAKTGASTLGALLLAGALAVAAALGLSNVGGPAGRPANRRSVSKRAVGRSMPTVAQEPARGPRALRRGPSSKAAGAWGPTAYSQQPHTQGTHGPAAALLHDQGGFIGSSGLFALIAAGMLSLGLLGAGGALAYLSAASEKTVNPLSVGENTIQIVEDFPAGPQPRPGESFTKKVQVKNTGNCPCYVRVLASFSTGDVADHTQLDYDRANWTRGADGYDYYVKPLAPGKTTPALFTTVTVLKGAETTPGGFVNFDLNIKAESTYADPDLTPEEAFAALSPAPETT